MYLNKNCNEITIISKRGSENSPNMFNGISKIQLNLAVCSIRNDNICENQKYIATIVFQDIVLLLWPSVFKIIYFLALERNVSHAQHRQNQQK